MNAPVVGTFEGRIMRAFLVNDRPAVMAFELGRALGYSNPHRLVGKIRESWYRELRGGEHFDVLTGQNLKNIHSMAREFPAAGNSPETGRPVPARPHRLMVLYEAGVNLVLLKSEAPLADKIRAWLANEVMPQLARTGSYTPKAEAPAPAPAPKAPELPPPPPRDVQVVQREPVLAAHLRQYALVLDADHVLLGRHAAIEAGLSFDEFVDSAMMSLYYQMRAQGRFGSMR